MKKEERLWMQAVPSMPLNQAIRQLDRAFQDFFEGCKQGKKIGFPKFKKRSNQQAATFAPTGEQECD